MELDGQVAAPQRRPWRLTRRGVIVATSLAAVAVASTAKAAQAAPRTVECLADLGVS